MADSAQPITPSTLGGLAVAALLLGLGLGTLGVVAAYSGGGAGLGPQGWAAVRFTVIQALLSAGISTLLAIPVARALARRRFRGRSVLVTLLGAPFILPVIVAVLGLLAVYGRAGILSQILQFFGLQPLNIYGLTGVVLAHVFFNLPLATRLVLLGWNTIPGEHFRLAAQLGMTSGNISRHLELPMLRSVLPGAFAAVFLLCMTSFAVALTLGGGPKATTVELAIYQAFRFDFDLSKAALLALLQFALGALAALIAWKMAAPSGFGPGLGQPVKRWDSDGLVARSVDTLVLGAVSLFLLVPLIMVVLNGLSGLDDLPITLIPAIFRSLGVAIISALMTLGMAIFLAQTVVRLEPGNKRLAAGLEATGYLSIAASPMVIGTGLFILLFGVIDPTLAALPVTALVNALMSLPFALRALIPAIRDVEHNYGRLAGSLGLSGWHRFRLVVWPRIRGAAGFATGLAAALSMGDLGVVALFADPKAATLPLMLYRLMGSYQIEAANAAALILVTLSLGLFWLFDRGGRVDAGI